jgi:hypothetical protein
MAPWLQEMQACCQFGGLCFDVALEVCSAAAMSPCGFSGGARVVE